MRFRLTIDFTVLDEELTNKVLDALRNGYIKAENKKVTPEYGSIPLMHLLVQELRNSEVVVNEIRYDEMGHNTHTPYVDNSIMEATVSVPYPLYKEEPLRKHITADDLIELDKKLNIPPLSAQIMNNTPRPQMRPFLFGLVCSDMQDFKDSENNAGYLIRQSGLVHPSELIEVIPIINTNHTNGYNFDGVGVTDNACYYNRKLKEILDVLYQRHNNPYRPFNPLKVGRHYN